MVLRIAMLWGLLVVGIIAVTHSFSSTRSSFKPITDRDTTPDFTFRDAYGSESKLSDYRGKVVLVNFWATWCGPCRIEIPWFVEFERAFAHRGFSVIGISLDEDGWQAVKPYAERQKINYPILIGTDALAQRFGGIPSASRRTAPRSTNC